MMKKIRLLSILFAVFLVSCGPRIYKSPEFDTTSFKYKTVAILPADVTTQLRPNESKKLTAEQIEDLTQKTGYDIQDKMYSWLLRRSEKDHYSVSFQDITRTNALLKQANI